MPELTVADALRDSAESHKMPSGVELDEATAALHAIAADVLKGSLEQLCGHE